MTFKDKNQKSQMDKKVNPGVPFFKKTVSGRWSDCWNQMSCGLSTPRHKGPVFSPQCLLRSRARLYTKLWSPRPSVRPGDCQKQSQELAASRVCSGTRQLDEGYRICMHGRFSQVFPCTSLVPNQLSLELHEGGAGDKRALGPTHLYFFGLSFLGTGNRTHNSHWGQGESQATVRNCSHIC